MASENCGDHVGCGKEKNCPDYPNHGRACFAVTGTSCRGEKQGSCEEKIGRCRELCDFYKELMGLDSK